MAKVLCIPGYSVHPGNLHPRTSHPGTYRHFLSWHFVSLMLCISHASRPSSFASPVLCIPALPIPALPIPALPILAIPDTSYTWHFVSLVLLHPSSFASPLLCIPAGTLHPQHFASCHFTSSTLCILVLPDTLCTPAFCFECYFRANSYEAATLWYPRVRRHLDFISQHGLWIVETWDLLFEKF